MTNPIPRWIINVGVIQDKKSWGAIVSLFKITAFSVYIIMNGGVHIKPSISLGPLEIGVTFSFWRRLFLR